ncbi:ATP-binding protein [Halovulum sp. GXIMD14793]
MFRSPFTMLLYSAGLVGAALGAVHLGVAPAIAIGFAAGIGVIAGTMIRPHAVIEPRTDDIPVQKTGIGRAVLSQLPVPLIVIARSERLTFLNPAAKALLPQARVGSPIASVIRAPAFHDAIEGTFEEGIAREFSYSVSRDQDRFFEARAVLLPAEVSDFGDEDQLIVQIEDRTRDRAMLQTRTDFVANASHELRTPLASILGYIETLQGHAKDDPEAQERFLDIMMKQAGRMQRLVDDLMSLSRIEMNAHVRPEEVVDLHRIALDAASGLYPQATVADVMLQIEIAADEPGPRVLGDRDQLAQVIANLVDNAIKYSGAGEKVRVTAADPDPRYPRHVGIAVIDTGPGIPREAIPRLTERFYRVSIAQSRDKGGTGLGLAITKHILNRHGGALDVRSKLEQGSTFTVWLPAVTLDDTKPDESRDTLEKDKEVQSLEVSQ